jgi:MFS family permease
MAQHIHDDGGPVTSKDGLWAPHRRRLTSGLALSTTVVAFEALSVATILPIVSRHLGDFRLYGWVFSAFLLASLFGIVAAGRFADRGRLGRPMALGLLLFGAGLAVGGAAPDMPVLVAGRALQGLGAGTVPAIAYVAISRAYPPGLRPRMFAVLSTAWVVPGLVGPVVAAFVATSLGWRWVFLGLLPLVGAIGVMAVSALRVVPPPSTPRHVAIPYLAIAGVIGGGALALGSITVIDQVPALGAGVAAGAALLAVSLRRLSPRGTLVAARGLPATILSRGLITCTFYAGEVYVPYALTAVRHAPTSTSAVALMVSTLTWTAGSWTQARFVARAGPRRLVRTGECVTVSGVALMGAALVPGTPIALGICAWGVAGAGMGLAYAPLSLTTLDRSPPGEEGTTTASLQLFDVLGQAIGAGAAGALVAASVAALGHRLAVALAFVFAGAVGVVALGVSARLPRRLAGGSAPSAALEGGGPPPPEGAGGGPTRGTGRRPVTPGGAPALSAPRDAPGTLVPRTAGREAR